MRRICVSLLLLGLAGCGLLDGSPALVDTRPAGLAAGDRLRIVVAGEDELTGVFVIDGAGNVALPLLGMVPAAGMSEAAFADTLRARLKDGYLKQPDVTVSRADNVPQLAAMPPPLRASEDSMEVP